MQKNSKQEKLIEFLLERKLITEDQLKDIREEMKQTKKTLAQVLVERELIKDSHLGQIIADINGWEFVNLKNEPIDERTLRLIPEPVADNKKAVAFAQTAEGIKVAMANPDDTALIHLLKKRTATPIIPHYATMKGIWTAMQHYNKEIGTAFNTLIESHAKEAIGGEAKDSAVVQIVDLLLYHGYENKASDIHVEPGEEETVVRFRIDGMLHDIITMPRNIHDLVITRVKIMSRMRTDEHQAPQDGKMRFDFEGEPVDVRVSIVPTTKGENIVMRLLSDKARRFSLEELGLSDEDYEKLKRAAKKPWGMILATGPTGSGKTTSLYSILKILNKREVNIATIEDPVEYNLEGVTQINVNPKTDLTFATGLRSIVRQDPDVIMVGEIRDAETANIAVSSAMTGHVVLSTLHTNDAPTTIPRLLDMEVEPFLAASTVNLAIGQRLLRKICTKCVHSYDVELSELKDKVPKEVIKKFQEKGIEKLTLYKGGGCEMCQNTGYIGRVGVFELMEMTEGIREMITKNATADIIKQKAVEEGMTTMLDDAVEKVLSGVTTLEELLRVVKE